MLLTKSNTNVNTLKVLPIVRLEIFDNEYSFSVYQYLSNKTIKFFFAVSWLECMAHT